MSSVLRLIIAFGLCFLPAKALPSTTMPGTHCPTLEVSDGKARQSLMHYVCYHTSPPGDPAYQAQSPAELPTDLTWTPARGNDLVFTQTDSVYWIQLDLQNSAAKTGFWYLRLSYPLLDDVTFWQSGASEHARVATGDRHSFDSRPVDYRYFLLPVTLEQGQSRTITLRIKSSGALNVPLSLVSADQAIAQSNRFTMTHGMFYGALLVLALFNLLLFLSSRTIYYLHCAFYITTMGMFMFAMGGFANQYLWPDSPNLANNVIPISLALCALAMLLFSRSFLEAGQNTWADRTMTTQVWISVGFLSLTMILPYSLTIAMNTVLGIAVISSMMAIAVVRCRQGYQPAVWYLTAWVAMLAGVLIYALAAFGHITHFLATEAMMQTAVGGQVVLLNYAMVQRWRLLNEKLLAVEHNARTELESKVHERTAQLRNTMKELEQANRQLAVLSMNDSLTGLSNRRHMDNRLSELHAEALRTGHPLTIALIDADHFKKINDTWGHSFGDNFLQMIAEILKQHVKRPRDMAVRFGGEEFALLLPDTDCSGAKRVCEAILSEVRKSQLETPEGGTAAITLSAGIASLAPGESTADLFKRADKALYQAKASGRDRINLAEKPVLSEA
ncbi:diguanylate cyclase [Marinobacter salinisoli]|uniref:diguanylate cyclase n=1 Tax=Marinobacter salinisoli TaxID=2769486 RepID=A0ABX7MR49_9GAMM|nr:diguanylate cyclase [Marinobacter salinisoli]QSP93581.1 diguanylate cyclase [Marinobacter salinisoli]